MRPVKDTTVKGLVSLGLIFSISCAATKLPEVEIRPLSQYSLSQRKSDIALAIDPYFEEERVKKYFGFNLLEDGILPVFLIVENQGDDLILIRPNDLVSAFGGLGLTAAAGGVAKTDSAINQGEIKQAEVMSSAVLAGMFLGMIIPILTSVVYGEKDFTLIRYNVRKKTLLDRTLSKNEAASGFVFLKVGDKPGLSKIRYLQVRVKNLRTGEMETFVYPVKSKIER